jgi:hypothetical protein
MREFTYASKQRSRFSRKLTSIIQAILASALIFWSSFAVAGGCEIDQKSVVFDNDPEKHTFSPDTEIVMQFQYTCWAYGGKPYEYIVFELTTVDDPMSTAHRFITTIRAVHGVGAARFSVPYPNRSYVVSYHEAALFTYEPLVEALHGGFVTSANSATAINTFYKTNYPGTKNIATIRSSSGGPPTDSQDTMTVYFKTGLKQEVDERIAGKLPPTFQWRKGEDSSPNVQNEEYSYRLDPLEDWSLYSNATKATYYLLTPGNYLFQVRARYTIQGKEKETAIASLPIDVRSLISAPPPLDEKGEAVPPHFWEVHRYTHKSALLIAVSEYRNPTFTALPYVHNDARLFALTLQQYRFDVETLDKDTTTARVEAALNRMSDRVAPGDAVVVYFSGHGSYRGLSNFLVTTDCDPAKPEESCVTYDWLKKWIDTVVEKGAQHALLVLDACQAGLGLYSKSEARTPLQDLFAYPGAHMMTAGLMEQEAHIDIQDGVSVFTQYLAKGLSGEADWNKDKIITLSELLAYVQNKVSKQVSDKYGESQVPVMGKVKGAGEMLFRLP